MLKTLPRSRTPTGTAYLDRGQGDEVTVLIHGVGMRIEAWEPQIDVISEPEYVVGTAMIGMPVSSATAFASPIAEPPPIATQASAPSARVCDVAVAAFSTGTCCATLSYIPAQRVPS